jgi:hypothetical protein
VYDALEAVLLQGHTDIVEAREAFIRIRTHVWQALSEEERKQVMPTLRDVYNHIRTHA